MSIPVDLSGQTVDVTEIVAHPDKRFVLYVVRSERSVQVEPVEVHHLGPRRNEVAHELLLGVIARVDLGDGAKLGVRAKDDIHARGGPLQFVRPTIAALERRFRR